jgi:hypothetical protein
MSAPDDSSHSRRVDVADILGVLLLSITAVLTAWCGFESSKWGGEMSIAFSQASSARVTATDLASQARDQRAIDLVVYAQWIEATGAGQTELADYVEARFPPVLEDAFEAWEADGMVEPSPFARPEYVPPGTVEAEAKTAEAEAAYERALVNNQRGDNYSLLTVLFALVLFLTAMSQRKIVPWAARVFLGLGIVVAVVGIVILTTFPVKL